jgi:hypothetical protein
MMDLIDYRIIGVEIAGGIGLRVYGNCDDIRGEGRPSRVDFNVAEAMDGKSGFKNLSGESTIHYIDIRLCGSS